MIGRTVGFDGVVAYATDGPGNNLLGPFCPDDEIYDPIRFPTLDDPCDDGTDL
jgi:hypothetical protein